MLWVDNAIIALIIIYTSGGLVRGYSQEIYSLIVWFIGILTAWFFCHHFSAFLVHFVTGNGNRMAVSFIALLLITLMVGWVVNLLLGNAIKKYGLNLLDRMGGLVFGFAHGMLAVLVLTLIAGLTTLPNENWWFKSKFLPSFQTIASIIKPLGGSKMSKEINYPNQP